MHNLNFEWTLAERKSHKSIFLSCKFLVSHGIEWIFFFCFFGHCSSNMTAESFSSPSEHCIMLSSIKCPAQHVHHKGKQWINMKKKMPSALLIFCFEAHLLKCCQCGWNVRADIKIYSILTHTYVSEKCDRVLREWQSICCSMTLAGSVLGKHNYNSKIRRQNKMKNNNKIIQEIPKLECHRHAHKHRHTHFTLTQMARGCCSC